MAKRLILCVVVCAVVLVGCRRGETGQAAFHAGNRALEGGRYDRSIRLFQKSISQTRGKEQKAFIYNSLGIACFRGNRRDEAIQAFKSGMQLNPDLVEPVYNLAVLLAESGSRARAVAYLEKASQLETDDTRSLEYLGYLYGQDRQWDRARLALSEALARAPRSSRIITALAVLDLQTGDAEKAVSGFYQALEHDARYLPAIYNLGVVNLQMNNKDQARAYFEEYARLALQRSYTDKARQALKGIGAAISTLKPTRSGPAASPGDGEVSATTVPPPSPSFEELMKIAGILEKQGREEAAVNNYLRAAAEAERTEDSDRQERALGKAVEVCSDNARANYALGTYFLEHKRNAEAMTRLKHAVGLNADWYDANMALAGVAVKEGEFDTAVVCLKLADRSQPDKPDALWALAQLYDQRLGLTNLAVQSYAGFVRRFPADPRVAESRERLKALGAE